MPTQPELITLATLLRRRQRNDASVDFELSADWQQGRTTYGGLIAALALQAMRDVVGAEWPLRALQSSFVGPIAGAMRVEVRQLRQGRNVRHAQGTVWCDGEIAAVFLGIFGAARETRVPRLLPKPHAAAHPPDGAHELPYIAGVTPRFIQHLQPRWAEGDRPYSGGGSWHSRIHLRLRHGEGTVDAELLAVLLADMPPTPAVGHLHAPAPSSSVSWELELPARAAAVDTAGWWRADTDVLCAADGYVNQRTLLWTPEGTLAAVGCQVVAVYG